MFLYHQQHLTNVHCRQHVKYFFKLLPFSWSLYKLFKRSIMITIKPQTFFITVYKHMHILIHILANFFSHSHTKSLLNAALDMCFRKGGWQYSLLTWEIVTVNLCYRHRILWTQTKMTVIILACLFCILFIKTWQQWLLPEALLWRECNVISR